VDIADMMDGATCPSSSDACLLSVMPIHSSLVLPPFITQNRHLVNAVSNKVFLAQKRILPQNQIKSRREIPQ
jgi:hypothetical protein